jgi:ribosomal protein S27E
VFQVECGQCAHRQFVWVGWWNKQCLVDDGARIYCQACGGVFVLKPSMRIEWDDSKTDDR